MMDSEKRRKISIVLLPKVHKAIELIDFEGVKKVLVINLRSEQFLPEVGGRVNQR